MHWRDVSIGQFASHTYIYRYRYTKGTDEFGGVETTRVGPATAGRAGGQGRQVEDRTQPQVDAGQPREQRRLETPGEVRVGRVHRDVVALQTHITSERTLLYI